MSSYMYILECADGSYYTGSTKNLERRLWEHQNGEGANYTRRRLPVNLVYCEPFDRVENAFRREKQVQGWSRRKKQALMEGNPEKLIEFSKNYTQYGASASTGPASTGPASTGPASTGPASTGPASTGPASTGPASTSPASTSPASTSPASTSPASTSPASTSSASGGDESALESPNKPPPELVEGRGDTINRGKPPPELVEGRGDTINRGKPPQGADSGEFGKAGDCR